ncbi:ribokinase [Desertihabitans aurantiacus]|uniref:ribokinase n=1 Tax=Desertihabitans aurantiacus TaxID=2282477 RepID=UPI000DF75723|nr:ribokinase [Desertihabitans aurantiacus]
MSGPIIVVGSLNADLQLAVDALPAPGETALATRVENRPGGKGANQASAVALCGGECWMVGAVGDDEDGRLLVTALREAGVRTDAVAVLPEVRSGRAVVMVAPTGENAIVVLPGANSELTASDVRRLVAGLPPAEVLLAQGELPVPCIVAAAEVAAATGARFVLNLAPYVELPLEVLAACDPLVVNEHEAAALGVQLAGQPLEDEPLLDVLVQHTRSVVITLGGAGAVYGSATERGSVPAPRVPVVDTSGAGDAFVGAAAVELSRSGGLAAACRAGVAAGSLAVQHRGARMPRVDDSVRMA